MRRLVGWCAVVMLFFSGAAFGGPMLLYTIGPDGYSVPDRLFSFSSTDIPFIHENWIWDLADGTLGLFTGGLTYQASNNRLYAVANGELVDFGLNGLGLNYDVALTGGVGWLEGLSVGPNQDLFYAIGETCDTGCVPWIYEIDPTSKAVTPLFAVGDGSQFFFGLTYDPANKLFYGIALDSDGNSFLYSIDTVAKSYTEITAVTLGTGYTGGIAYDVANDVFFAIWNDSDGYSYLDRITLGSSPSVNFVSYFYTPANGGFWNAGLTFGPEENGPQTTPEPATGLLAGLAMIGAGLARRFIRSHSK